MKRITLIFVLFLLLPIETFCKPSGYFCFANLNIRTKPTVKSRIIKILPQGTSFIVIEKTENKEKIDNISNYWYKIRLNDVEGWVFGAFIVEDIGQNKQEFINRYEFVKYYNFGQKWTWTNEEKTMGCELYLGVEFGITKNFDKNLLELDFEVDKKGIFVFVKDFKISKFVKVKQGYKIYSNGEYIATIDYRGNNLIIIDIIQIKTERDNIRFDTKELINQPFKMVNDHFNPS